MKLNLNIIKRKMNLKTFEDTLKIIDDEVYTTDDLEIIDNEYRLKNTETSTFIIIDGTNLLDYYCECVDGSDICEHLLILIILTSIHLNIPIYEPKKSIKFDEKEQLDILSTLDIKFDSNNLSLVPVIEIDKHFIKLSVEVFFECRQLLPNLYKFIQAINNREYCQYKLFGFTHNIESFDEASKSLIMMIKYLVTPYNKNSMEINSNMLYDILKFYENKKIYIIKDTVKYTINNELIKKDINFDITEDKVTLSKIEEDYHEVCSEGIIAFSKDESFFYQTTPVEMKLIQQIQDKKFIPIDKINNEFMRKIFPHIRQKVNMEKKLQDKFPDLPLVINSYFDFEGHITLECKYLENGLFKEAHELTDINQGILDNYNNILKTYNIHNNTIKHVDDIVTFLSSDLNILKSYGEVFLSQKLRNLGVKKQSNINVSARYNTSGLQLDFDSDYNTHELDRILSAYKRKVKYVILNNDQIVQLTNDNDRINQIVDDFDLDTSNLSNNLLPNTFIMKLFNNASIEIDEKLQEIITDIQAYKNFDINLPTIFREYLKDYQIEGVKWLNVLTKHGFGGLLADDMGLGKSLQIITHISMDNTNKPSLIVVPKSLVYNWSNEFKKWNSNDEFITILGSSSKRESIIRTIDGNKKVIYITSYDSIQNDIEMYKTKFRYIILDEAQHIKNANTKKSIASKILKGDIRIALTGTPVENSLADLWSIFDFLLPKYLSSYKQFKDNYERLILENDVDAIKNLKSKIAPFILRRTKQEVLKELPEKKEKVYYVKLENRQKDLYDAYAAKIKLSLNQKTKFDILTMISRLRQICVSPSLVFEEYTEEDAKIELALELINNYISSGHKILLFSQFPTTFKTLKEKFLEHNITSYTITGETPSHKRVDLVEQFNKDNTNIFLLSLKAGAVGLNLTGADTVILLDPWWNVCIENQATDRAYRLGQSNIVNVAKIICANTIEEKVIKLQKEKQRLASLMIDDNEDFVKNLDLDDLSFLLD